MTCYHPNVMAWYLPKYALDRPGGLTKPLFLGPFRGLDVDYTESITLPDWIVDKLALYQLPCGKCEGCRLAQMQQWSFRAQCELKTHPVSAFLTLTVDDDHMDKVFPSLRLCHRPFQLFLKRLRKELSPLKVRYIMCGEYGTHTCRPHYHVILFGWFPPDYFFLKQCAGYVLYTSDMLSRLWPYGFHTVAYANDKVVRYLVGYVMKKASHPLYPVDAPPYLRVSTRPAIGLDFFKEFGEGLFAHGADLQFPNSFVYYGSKKMALPRYFLKKYREVADNVDYVSLMNFRSSKLKELPMLDMCDLRRMEDFQLCKTQVSHNSFRENEV